ncbi:MAG: hypothetical protein AAGA30_13590 [Planctomycetota bacterium]
MAINFGCLLVSLVLGLPPLFAAKQIENSKLQSNSQQVLLHAHAHNDYYHQRPLLDALERGFFSVEADVFLVGQKLLIGHSRWEFKPGRTLSKLYLEPLAAMVKKSPQLFQQARPFIILIDFKGDGEPIYRKLKQELQPYRDILCGFRDEKFETKPIQIIISGNCPRRSILQDPNRLVGIDGRLSDLDSDIDSDSMPLISARWGANFKWRGRTNLTNKESKKLKSFVQKIHAKKQLIRFWATPENRKVWKFLLDNQVDLINTDKIDELKDFLRAANK